MRRKLPFKKGSFTNSQASAVIETVRDHSISKGSASTISLSASRKPFGFISKKCIEVLNKLLTTLTSQGKDTYWIPTFLGPL